MTSEIEKNNAIFCPRANTRVVAQTNCVAFSVQYRRQRELAGWARLSYRGLGGVPYGCRDVARPESRKLAADHPCQNALDLRRESAWGKGRRSPRGAARRFARGQPVGQRL